MSINGAKVSETDSIHSTASWLQGVSKQMKEKRYRFTLLQRVDLNCWH